MPSLSIGPTSLDWPAWVQAVGSVAAILVALWLARRDRLRVDHAKIEDDACFATFCIAQIAVTEGKIADLLDRYSDDGRDAGASPVGSMRVLIQMFFERIVDPLDRTSKLALRTWPDVQMADKYLSSMYIVRSYLTEIEVIASREAADQEGAWLRFDDVLEQIAILSNIFVYTFKDFVAHAESYRTIAKNEGLAGNYSDKLKISKFEVTDIELRSSLETARKSSI